MTFKLPPLYPILDVSVSPRPLLEMFERLADAGVRLVQLREKKATARNLLEDACGLVELAAKRDLPVIINDRADIAWLAKAAGVHLGQEDLPAAQARTILGTDKIIGYSTHNLAQALEADQSSADYVAIGPVASTTSKENPDPIVSMDELKLIRAQVRKPLVAIGGITPEIAASLFDIGIDSVAVIRGLLCAENVSAKVKAFLNAAGQ